MIFFQCSIEFHFTHGHQKCYLHLSRGYAAYENTDFGVFIAIYTLQKSNILYFCELTVSFLLMMSSPEVLKPTALERGGYRYFVRKHHRQFI